MAKTNDSQIKAVDRELEARASGAMRELMEHRWHWTLDGSNAERKTFTAYGALVGRSMQAISNSARGYEMLLHGAMESAQDAYTLAGLGADQRTAVSIVAERDDISIPGAQRHRRPEVKAIAAEIADLPAEDKERIARDLANDPDFKAAVHREQERQTFKQRAERAAAEDRASHRASPLQRSIDTARLRLAIGKAEQAAQAVLDGVTRDDLDSDEVASLERSSHRARLLADYIDAVLGVGDIDEAYARLVEESA